jgi:hypothetical protein
MRSRHVAQPQAAEQRYGKREKAPTGVQRPLGAATWEWNLETKEYRWSEEMYQLFNLTSPPYPLRTGTFLNLVHPQDRQRVVNALGKALVGAQPYHMYHHILRGDGSVCLVRGEAKVWFDGGGRPIRIMGTLQQVKAGPEGVATLEKKAGNLNCAIKGI